MVHAGAELMKGKLGAGLGTTTGWIHRLILQRGKVTQTTPLRRKVQKKEWCLGQTTFMLCCLHVKLLAAFAFSIPFCAPFRKAMSQQKVNYFCSNLGLRIAAPYCMPCNVNIITGNIAAFFFKKK